MILTPERSSTIFPKNYLLMCSCEILRILLYGACASLVRLCCTDLHRLICSHSSSERQSMTACCQSVNELALTDRDDLRTVALSS